ncbi:hypothetical protein CDAR_87521 [Caerostris darwini]|uniref:Uncharacterized protein n=1 Tax=Caerostris darwini TaxID=1538125 RepID=A0AAV4TLK8_9ARAC|nr:hypothetical protein CDAR_87521 [Caerostris darwini]
MHRENEINSYTQMDLETQCKVSSQDTKSLCIENKKLIPTPRWISRRNTKCLHRTQSRYASRTRNPYTQMDLETQYKVSSHDTKSLCIEKTKLIPTPRWISRHNAKFLRRIRSCYA